MTEVQTNHWWQRTWRRSVRVGAILLISGCAAAITILMWFPLANIAETLLVTSFFVLAILAAVAADRWGR